MSDKGKRLVEAIKAKKEKENKRKEDILAKSKGKKLSLEERIARIEELLNIND